MKLEELLRSVPVGQWQVDQIYSLEWYDGPRTGVCALGSPRCEFFFDLLDERYNPEGPDDRLFRLAELPRGSVANVLAAVHDLASTDRAARQRAEQRLNEVQGQKRLTGLVVWSQDLRQFLGCWQVDPAGNGTGDWFAALSVPQPHAT